ncbi:FliH/SctL family protein [Oceanospirillaceae bacterium]|nr:FliH/SctL family protein [Oceanospirillaceae bacterium]
MSDNVIKHDFTGDYQTFETSLSGLDVEFSPFFSLTSETEAASKEGFSAAEVSVVSQAQAKHEDWKVFTVPHEDANFAAASDTTEEGALLTATNGVEVDTIETPDTTSHDEGYEQGYQEGYDQGFALGQTEGELKGIETGQQQVEVLEQQRNKDMQVALEHLSQLTNTLSDELLQPMQTLAVHLAKELVRGELSLSSQAIERLIMLSMEQLQSTQSTIQVHMNPLEFERLQQHKGLPEQLVLQPSNDVSMGSIKVEHADSWVEDLMEDRLAQISQQAFGFIDEKLIEPLQVLDDKPLPKPEVELESTLELEAEAETETETETETEILAEIFVPEDEGLENDSPDQALATEQDLKLGSDIDTDTEAVTDTDIAAELDSKVVSSNKMESDLELHATADSELETAQAVELEPELKPEVELKSTLELEAEAETQAQAEIVAPEDEGLENKSPDETVATEQDLKLESDIDTDTDVNTEPNNVINEGQSENDQGTSTHD